MGWGAYNNRVVSSEAPSTSSGQVLYRKWRPQTFAEVVGQEPITRTLRNSVASGKVAHAYLLCGPRGTGKTSLGRLIAKAVNCDSPVEGEPCNRCDSCRAFLEGRAVDLVEMDAASNRGIDEIRKLRDRVGLAPMGGRYKLYLIDEVHMLTAEAYNALLKTLEEPPPHVLFVLATTEPQRVPATIISRCQRFDLRRIPLAAVGQRLAVISQGEGFHLEEASLQEVARAASGSLRDAINILEQLVAYYGPSPSIEQAQEALGLSVDARSGQLAGHILARDLAAGLRLVAVVRDDGVDMRQFGRQVVNYLRGLLLVKCGAADSLDVAKEQLEEMRRLAGQTEAAEIVQALRTFGHLDFRDDPLSSLPLELALVDYVAAGDGEVRVPNEPAGSAGMPAGRQELKAAPTAASEPGSTVAPEPPVEVAGEAKAETPDQETPEEAAEAAAQPEATPAPALAVGDDFLDRVRLACKEMDKQVAAYLNGSCEVKALEDDTLVLGFYFPFHQGRIEQEGNRRIVEEAASQVLGRPVRLKLEPTPLRQQAKVPGGHLVQAARELGARPIGGGQAPVGKGESHGEPARASERRYES